MDKGLVLVVEDDQANRKLLRTLLQLGQYQVLEAVDGEAGVQLARAHRPHAILMDLQLPGMSGLAATELLKADPDLQGIPVIAVTSRAMDGDEHKARSAGCDGYITKPIDTRRFMGTLERLLGKCR